MSGHPSGTVLSVNVGLPSEIQWHDRTVHSAIWKRPVEGPVLIRRLNLEGDGQGDRAGHGGEQRAVMLYQIESYRYWEDQLGVPELEFGSFGENLTVTGLADDTVCIGDRYEVGQAVLEVTQPRVTCFRVGIRLGQPQMPNLLVSHHRPGFYLRVIEQGLVQAGDTINLISRGRHGLTVAEVDALLYLPDPDIERIKEAADTAALSPGWQQSFRDMLTAHEQVGAPAGAPAGGNARWRGFRPLRVVDLVHETEDVLSIKLEAPDGSPLPLHHPGQYLTLRAEDAALPAPVRSYSISSAPGEDSYRISVKREPLGVVSTWLHTQVGVGDLLQIAAPRGAFTLDSGANNPVVLISAGIGATPVLAMLHVLAESTTRRAVWWLHTARDTTHHVFVEATTELLDRLPDAHTHIYLTRASAASQNGAVARMTEEALAKLDLPTDATVYLCGPEAFMTAISAACLALGITDVRSETFGSLASINPGIVGESPQHRPHQPEGSAGTGSTITFSRSGLSAPWAADRYSSLLEFAEACDVPTRWSCRSGVCHICSTPMLSGSVRYPDPPLVPPSEGEILLCCSRPVGAITLDL